MPRGKSYSDEEKAATLAALRGNAGNVGKTARECGVPKATLIRWIQQQSARSIEGSTGMDPQRTPEKQPSTAERIAAKLPDAERILAAKLDVIADKLAGGMTDDKITSASLPQLAVAMGGVIDKARLLRGKATAINENWNDERLAIFRERYSRTHAASDAGADACPESLHPPGSGAAADPVSGAGVS
jgi:transposase-like protein